MNKYVRCAIGQVIVISVVQNAKIRVIVGRDVGCRTSMINQTDGRFGFIIKGNKILW